MSPDALTGLLSRPVTRRRFGVLGAGLGAASALGTAGCGASSPGPGADTARGPISIWYSNNTQEVTWGEQLVAAWNTAHPSEKVTAEQIPSGKSSEEVVSASITAGNAPGLILNISPASVAGFVRQGGVVPLSRFPGADAYITARTGARAEQYRSGDGQFHQLPWKSNPVMVFYNRALFKKAGLDPDHPRLATYADFLATARTLVAKKVAPTAIWPSPNSEWYSAEGDFYPLYAAATGGTPLVVKGKTTYDDANGPGGGRLLPHALRGGTVLAGDHRPRRVRDRAGGHGHRRAVGDRLVQGRRGLGRGPRPQPDADTRVEAVDLLRREEHLAHDRVRPPGDRVGLHEVRHQPGAGRTAPEHDRTDAAAPAPGGHLRPVLREEQGLRTVLRPGREDVGRPERRQRHPGVADLPRRLVQECHLRQGVCRRRPRVFRPPDR